VESAVAVAMVVVRARRPIDTGRDGAATSPLEMNWRLRPGELPEDEGDDEMGIHKLKQYSQSGPSKSGTKES